MRFETEPGEQAQVDWGHFGFIEHHGRQRRLYAFVMTLGWSRAMYVEFTTSTDATWWLRCHVHAFHYFGGVPKVVLHDNLKTAVLSRDADGTVHWNPRYLDFADYYGFTPQACRPYRAQTKGKVEAGIRYVRGNFWPGLRFVDLADLNRQGRDWLDFTANRAHPRHDRRGAVCPAAAGAAPAATWQSGVRYQPDQLSACDQGLLRQLRRQLLLGAVRVRPQDAPAQGERNGPTAGAQCSGRARSPNIVSCPVSTSAACCRRTMPTSARASRPVKRGTAMQIVPTESLTDLVAPDVEVRPLSWYDQLLEVAV